MSVPVKLADRAEGLEGTTLHARRACLSLLMVVYAMLAHGCQSRCDDSREYRCSGATVELCSSGHWSAEVNCRERFGPEADCRILDGGQLFQHCEFPSVECGDGALAVCIQDVLGDCTIGDSSHPRASAAAPCDHGCESALTANKGVTAQCSASGDAGTGQ